MELKKFKVGDIVTYNNYYPKNDASSTIKNLERAIVGSTYMSHGKQVVILSDFISKNKNINPAINTELHAWSELVKLLEPSYSLWN